MRILIKNVNKSLGFCLTVLKFAGFLTPHQTRHCYRFFLWVYCFSIFMFVVGGFLIAQTGAMFEIWGDLALMTSASFLLLTNLAFAIKIINVVIRKQQIQEIIDEANDELMAEDREEGIAIIKSCDRETTRSICLYIFLSGATVFGLSASAEKKQLPLRAWYPYDATKTPAYELTYANQSSAVTTAALVNVCLDTLVTSLIAVCRCRLRLVGLSLKTLCEGILLSEKHLLTPEQEKRVQSRLHQCVVKHEAALKTVRMIQQFFSFPILAQFTVSVVIICVTAYQLAMELNNRNWVRSFSMVTYLISMALQVFLYCYQGNQLTEESSEIAGAAYEAPWYKCSLRVRRSLLIVMVRTRRALRLTAGGFTTLSLACFTSRDPSQLRQLHLSNLIVSVLFCVPFMLILTFPRDIIKASYTFFTVLQQVEDRK